MGPEQEASLAERRAVANRAYDLTLELAEVLTQLSPEYENRIWLLVPVVNGFVHDQIAEAQDA